jgi:hypothetical protein
MTRRSRKALAIAAAGALGLTGLALCFPTAAPRLGFPEFLLFPDDTVCGQSYSESAFNALAPGLTRAEVRTVMGEPLEIELYAGGFSGVYLRTLSLENGIHRVTDTSTHTDPWAGATHEAWSYCEPGPRYDSYHIRVLTFAGDSLAASHTNYYSD